MSPYTVYYVHTQDERGALPNWRLCQDYACVVNAESQQQAIEKTKAIALNQSSAKFLKILGIGHAKSEWVNESRWMETDPDYYREQAQLLKKQMDAKRQLDTTW